MFNSFGIESDYQKNILESFSVVVLNKNIIISIGIRNCDWLCSQNQHPSRTSQIPNFVKIVIILFASPL